MDVGNLRDSKTVQLRRQIVDGNRHLFDLGRLFGFRHTVAGGQRRSRQDAVIHRVHQKPSARGAFDRVDLLWILSGFANPLFKPFCGCQRQPYQITDHNIGKHEA